MDIYAIELVYRAHVDVTLLKEIRDSVNKGLTLGNKRFVTQIEELTNKRVTPRKAGTTKEEISK